MRPSRLLILFLLAFGPPALVYSQAWIDPCKLPIASYTESSTDPATQSSQLFSRLLQDQPTHTSYWLWNEADKTWSKSHQEWFAYNPDDLLISVRDQSWDDNKWIDESRITYVYSHEQLLKLFQFEFWHESAWHLYTRYLYDYNPDQSLKTFRVQDWIDDHWIDRTMEAYETHAVPPYSRKTCSVWDESEWINTTRETQFYSGDGKTDCTVDEHWNGNDWINISREAFMYNEQSMISKILGQQWEYNQWNDASETQYVYNELTQLTQKAVHLLIASPWYQDYLWAYRYDDDSNVIESSFWTQEDEDFNIQMHSLNTFDQHNRILSSCSQAYKGYWLNREYIEFEYAQPTGLERIDISGDLLVYPNPVATDLYFSLPENAQKDAEVSIFTLSGTLCKKVTSSQTIDLNIPVDQLLPGAYLLKLNSAQFEGEKIFVKY